MKFISRHSLLLLLGFFTFSLNAQIVRMETVLGNIDIELHPDAAPATVANFLNYVNDGDYDNSFIHRNVLNFVVQGGAARFVGGQAFLIPVRSTVINEYVLPNVRGTISMAKPSNDPNGARNQWFINTIDNTETLGPNNSANPGSGGFTVFGTVINGMEVVDAINVLPTSTSNNPIDININGNTSAEVGVPYLSGNPDTLEENNAALFPRVYVLSENFKINSGLNGAWLNLDTGGQGILIEVLPTLDSVFMAWFTFDSQTPDNVGEAIVGSVEHRWLTGFGTIDHETSSVTLDLTNTTGGIFDNNATTTNSTPNTYGSMTLHFDDCENARVDYNLIDQELSGSFPMVRISDANVALCESLSQTAAQ